MSPQADVAIVSANLGGSDQLWTQAQQDIAVDWIYFTDNPNLRADGWKVVYQQPNGQHPCLAAKRFKMLPPVPHRYVIWIDANIRIESSHFAREALTYIQDGLAVFPHPFRNCIFQEAVETILTPKYDAFPVADQIRHYNREEGYPPNGGLYACGVIAWDREHPSMEQLGQEWLGECERWTYQDQLSFPIVCRRLGIKPGTFLHFQYQSPWLRIHKHLK